KAFLVAGAQGHHGGHVGFVKGCQDRGRALGGNQALRDALADSAHALARFAAAARRRSRRLGARRWLGLRGRRRALLEMGGNIFLEDAAAAPAAVDLIDIDAGIRGHLPRRGREHGGVLPVARCFFRRTLRNMALVALFLLRAALSSRARWRSAFLDAADDAADGYGRALRNRDSERAGRRRRDFAGSLFGFQLQDRFAGADYLAVSLEPARDRAFADRFANGGDFDVNGHKGALRRFSCVCAESCERYDASGDPYDVGLATRSSRAGRLASSRRARPSGEARTTWGTEPVIAASTSSFCSRRCTLCEPVAGLALASRPTYSKVNPKARKRRSMNVQPPMFCDSSWAQIHSRALRY